MTVENLFDGLQICAGTRSDGKQCGVEMTFFLDGGQLKAAAQRLLSRDFFIEDVMGVHFREGIEVLYHFEHFDQPGRVVLRVLTDPENPQVPTISDIFQGALWHERECADYFGIKFVGHPQPRPLLLPADFDGHPLLKPEKNRESLYAMLAACEPIKPVRGERYSFEPVETPAAAAEAQTEQN